MNEDPHYSSLRRQLRGSFEHQPREDGMNHPAETLLEKFLQDRTPRALEIVRDICTDARYPALSADTLQCLAHVPRAGSPEWQAETVRQALQSPDVQIRDAALMASEQWTTPEVLQVLQEHQEPEDWLRNYQLGIIQDIQEELAKGETEAQEPETSTPWELGAPSFEGRPFQAPNQFRYDSQAAWYITRWSEAASLHRGPRLEDALGKLMDELEVFWRTPVSLMNSQFLDEAEVFTLPDGSMVVAAVPLENPRAFNLYRFTGEAPENGRVWLDWGYHPPVASARRPLPGNQDPPISSLNIG